MGGNIEKKENMLIEMTKFCIPLILSGILQQLYNWADAFIVGNVLGEQALAAVGATASVNHFFIGIITGFAIGFAILVAHRFGAGDHAAVAASLSTFFVIFLVIPAAMALLGCVFTGDILELMNTTSDTIADAKTYLAIIFAGLPFLGVYNLFSSAMRSIGDSRAPFLAVLVSSVVNVALDIVFVALMDMGVAGAAIATVAAQAGMCVFTVAYAFKKHPLLRFDIRRPVFDKALFREGIRLGVPPMLQGSINSFGNMILQNFMNGFGTQTVAAITTAYRVDSLIILPVANFGSAVSTFVAQSRGAGDRKRCMRVLLTGSIMISVISLILTLTIVPTGGYIISIFGVGPEAVEIGRAFFACIALFYPVFGLGMALRGYLEGLGDVAFSSIACIAALVLRIILSYAFVSAGNMIIAYAEAAAWTLQLLLFALRARVKSRVQIF